jgi:hypothetical protein
MIRYFRQVIVTKTLYLIAMGRFSNYIIVDIHKVLDVELCHTKFQISTHYIS